MQAMKLRLALCVYATPPRHVLMTGTGHVPKDGVGQCVRYVGRTTESKEKMIIISFLDPVKSACEYIQKKEGIL